MNEALKAHGQIQLCIMMPTISSLTLKIPRLANWHEFARLTQGNILAPDFPPAFWAQDGGFNHSDDM